MHRSFECSTTESAVVKKQLTGHTAAQGASVQCIQAIDTERSPGLPSLMVTTRRRLMPHGTSFSFLQAVTQALHSMQRSASQRNFIRAMASSLRDSDLAERDFGLLHAGSGVVAVGGDRVRTFAEHNWVDARWVVRAQILPCVPAPEMEGHPNHALTDALGHQGSNLGLGTVLGSRYPDPGTIVDPSIRGVRWVDFDEHLLLQFGEPFVGARLFTATFVLDQASRTEYQGELLGDAPVDGRFLHRETQVRKTELLCIWQRRIFGDEVNARTIDWLAMHRDWVWQTESIHPRPAIAEGGATALERDPLNPPRKIERPRHGVGVSAPDPVDGVEFIRRQVTVPAQLLEHGVGELGIAVLDL